MKFQTGNIAKARIGGLNGKPRFFDYCCFYTVDIMLNQPSDFLLNHLCFIKVGNTLKEAEEYWDKMKENFSDAYINEGDEVAVIYTCMGEVLAIAKTGQNSWIDVKDNYKVKSFSDLNILFTCLKVY